MQMLIEWIRKVLILYFLMMIVLYFTAGESYKKFIRFFMGLVLLLTLLTPVLTLTGKKDLLWDGIAYEAYRQSMEEAQFDLGNMEAVEREMYQKQYEQAVEDQFWQAAEEKQLVITDIIVTLNSDHGLEQVVIREGMPGDGETLRNYLIGVYGLGEGQVFVQ